MFGFIRYLNKPDRSDPENKLRVLCIGPWRFRWRALWDNGLRYDRKNSMTLGEAMALMRDHNGKRQG